MQLVNVTPHEIVLRPEEGQEVVLPPSGQVARVAVSQEVVATVDGIPIVATTFGGIEGLPEPRPGVLYVASSMVAQAAAERGRRDVVSPDTGPTAVRDAEGRIVAVRRLQTWSETARGEYELQTMRQRMWEPFDSEATFSSLEEAIQALRDLAFHFVRDPLGGGPLEGPWRIVDADGHVVERGRWEYVPAKCTCQRRRERE